MSKVRGVVKAIKEKEGVSKKTGKPYKVFSIAVDHGDGSLTWYGCGFDRPDVREESVVTFEAGKNNAGYDTADVSTLEVDKAASGAQGQSQSNAAPSQAQNFGGDRQKSIITQTAFKIAAEVGHTLVEHKLMPLPPASSKEKKETAMEAYLQTVDQLAARYLGYFSDPAAFEEKFLADFAEGATDESPDEDGDEVPW